MPSRLSPLVVFFRSAPRFDARHRLRRARRVELSAQAVETDRAVRRVPRVEDRPLGATLRTMPVADPRLRTVRWETGPANGSSNRRTRFAVNRGSSPSHGRIPDFPEQCVGKDGL